MRLSVDCTPLLLRSAGVKNYLYYWVRELARQAGSNTVAPFPGLPIPSELNHESSIYSPIVTLPRIAALLFTHHIHGAPFDWLAGRADVFHATNMIRYPISRTRLTATIHDMTCWLMPELHTPANVKADLSFGANILKRATALIAVSENSRIDAINILGLRPERVVTIHSGVPDAYFDVTEAQIAEARARYSLGKPYVLFVGTIEPRKNLTTLLEAYQQLPRDTRDEFPLVIAGPMGWAPQAERARLVESGARLLGYVPERDLPAVTAGAAVFAYPSLYEGFGFPAAQAMACGVPVVTSNTSCLPEITGDGALHVDPRSAGAIAKALARLLYSRDLRLTVSARGRLKASNYRWERSAARSWQFFNAVV